MVLFCGLAAESGRLTLRSYPQLCHSTHKIVFCPTDLALSSNLIKLASGSTSAAASKTSTVLNHTIPPLYSCYLLRSFNPRRQATYIGSSPDPPRRINQHNGLTKGGATKTKSGRPWEQELIVVGFPSKLQALQFEWAWQNPHASRHLHAPKLSDEAKPTAQFPRTGLSNRPQTKIQVLMFMLTVPPWNKFNLSVILFSREAQTWWENARKLGPIVRTEAGAKKWAKYRLKAGKSALEDFDAWKERGAILDGIKIVHRFEGVDGHRLVRQAETESGIDRLRVDDDEFFEPHWEKLKLISDSSAAAQCGICAQSIDIEDQLSFLLCTSSNSACLSMYHPICLAPHFLQTTNTASQATEPCAPTSAAPLLPTTGTCPSCSSKLHWQDLVRGSYRRKEQVEGNRKKRKGVGRKKKTEEEKLAQIEVKAAKNAEKKLNKGKGKEKAVAPEEEDAEDSTSSTADDDSTGSEAEDDFERSWAQQVAAEGALESEDENFEEGLDDGILRFDPTQSESILPPLTINPTQTVSRARKKSPSGVGTTFKSTKTSVKAPEAIKKSVVYIHLSD